MDNAVTPPVALTGVGAGWGGVGGGGFVVAAPVVCNPLLGSPNLRDAAELLRLLTHKIHTWRIYQHGTPLACLSESGSLALIVLPWSSSGHFILPAVIFFLLFFPPTIIYFLSC